MKNVLIIGASNPEIILDFCLHQQPTTVHISDSLRSTHRSISDMYRLVNQVQDVLQSSDKEVTFTPSTPLHFINHSSPLKGQYDSVVIVANVDDKIDLVETFKAAEAIALKDNGGQIYIHELQNSKIPQIHELAAYLNESGQFDIQLEFSFPGSVVTRGENQPVADAISDSELQIDAQVEVLPQSVDVPVADPQSVEEKPVKKAPKKPAVKK